MTDISKTLEERQKTHGEFSSHARISMQLKLFIADEIRKEDKDLTYTQREALDMICHKIAGILNGNPDVHDHWHDIAGYATLVANRLEVNHE